MAEDRQVTAAAVGGVIAGGLTIVAALLTIWLSANSNTEKFELGASSEEAGVVQRGQAPVPLESGNDVTGLTAAPSAAPNARSIVRPTANEVVVTSTPTTIQGPYELDRTGVFLRLIYASERVDPTMYIGFRNGSNRSLSYRFTSVYLEMDGAPIRIRNISSNWIDLPPGDDGGLVFSLLNEGVVLNVGSNIDVSYEIEISSEGRSSEIRYETVRKTVLGFDPFRTQDRDLRSRSTFY